MAKSSTVLWTVVCLIEIGFLVLTFLGSVRVRLFGADPEGFYILLSTNFALLVIWVGLKGELLERRVGSELKGTQHELQRIRASRPGVRALVDREFYRNFGGEIRQARVGVAMAHLDTHPPHRERKTEAGEYYAHLAETIKSNPQTGYRRVERASREKHDWLRELVDTYANVPNFSLGVLLLPPTERRTGLISVQLVDDREAILVAVAEHYSSSGARDVWITDPAVTSLWKGYYDDTLWRPALKVIDSGRLNKSEWQKVLDFINEK
jgi:hypothetical protein